MKILVLALMLVLATTCVAADDKLTVKDEVVRLKIENGILKLNDIGHQISDLQVRADAIRKEVESAVDKAYADVHLSKDEYTLDPRSMTFVKKAPVKKDK